MNNKWKYVPFSDLFEWCKKSDIGSREGKQEGKYPLYIASATEIKRFDSYLESGESLIFGTGGNPCIHYETGKYAYTNHTEAAKRRHNNIYTKFYYYYFQKDNYSKLSRTFVGGGIKNSSKKKIGSILVPVVDYDEQKRIVNWIEELFSQLEEGVQFVKTVRNRLLTYQQAVLKEAFENVSSEAIKCYVKDICKDIKVGIVVKPSQYYTSENEGIRAFRSANVREFRINDSEWVYITKAGHEANLRSEIHTDDVLVVRSGYPGTACVVTDKYNGCNAIDILIAVPDQRKVLPRYLCAYTNSPLGRKIVQEKKRGVAQAHFNVSGYSNTSIILPGLEEQSRLLSYIDERLSIQSRLAQTIETTLDLAESMKQSVLKTAFEQGLERDVS